MKIAFFTPILGSGGIERTYINMAIAFANRGHTVEYIVTQKKGIMLDTVEKNPSIEVIDLSCNNLRYAFKPLKDTLRNKAYDIIISGPPIATGLCILIKKLYNIHTKVIAFLHAALNDDNKDDGLIGKLIKPTLKYLYPRADIIIAVTDGIKSYYEKLIPVSPKKIITINNLVIGTSFFTKSQEDITDTFKKNDFIPYILSIGRLRSVKGFDFLIKSYYEYRQHPYADLNLKLVIAGEGEDRAHLEQLISSLKLQESVFLIGEILNVLPILSSATCVISSSSSEGLGNVLVEALALQKPIIATNTIGAIEVLENGKYGTLVNYGDEQILAEAIHSLKKSNVTTNDNERWKDFSEEIIINRFLELFITLNEKQ